MTTISDDILVNSVSRQSNEDTDGVEIKVMYCDLIAERRMSNSNEPAENRLT